MIILGLRKTKSWSIRIAVYGELVFVLITVVPHKENLMLVVLVVLQKRSCYLERLGNMFSFQLKKKRMDPFFNQYHCLFLCWRTGFQGRDNSDLRQCKFKLFIFKHSDAQKFLAMFPDSKKQKVISRWGKQSNSSLE